MIGTLLALLVLAAIVSPAPEATPAPGPSVHVYRSADAAGYADQRDTAGAKLLADWAATHDIGTSSIPDTDLSELLQAVSDYPGDQKVTGLLRTAHIQRTAADAAYKEDDLASGGATHKAALATMANARKAMTADFDAALTKAGAATAYRTAASGAYLEVASLASAATVLHWVDGDTVETDRGRVRLVGVDTPEVSDRCSKADEATANAERLAPPGTAVTLRNPASVQESDKYGRLLRYVDVNGHDVGYSQIREALGVARYDGMDGYDTHPRQGAYRASSQAVTADDPLCYAAAAAASEWLLSSSDDEHHLWVLTAGQSRTTRLLLDADWDRAESLTAQQLAGARKDASARIQEAETARQAKAAAESAAKKAAAKAKAKAEAEAAAKKAAAEKEREEESRDSGSSSSSGDPYKGYTGPRCYAPGGKTWKPC